ncbi:importin subunit alpha-4-like [Tropilaelaps mercedesae]|uniref:Importin subunit alpha n=1 Tax=Tropilaelaps mercedesae TaxID=418985 RepID=A0A1V9XE26_9ACAR|nr:importin subunit alpha-4-like [Tropilaelaps mercedesae]
MALHDDLKPSASWRLADYKNLGRNINEMRRERNATSLELRKSKRADALFRRRNLPNLEYGEDIPDLTDIEDDAELFRRLNEVINNARSPIPDVRLKAVETIRKMVSSRKRPPIDELIQKGALLILIECLAPAESPQLQFEATWALTNVVSGTAEHTRAAVEAGIVPRLLTLLNGPHQKVSEQAVWALANIIGEGPLLRDFCINIGVISELRKFIVPTVPGSLLRNITWAVANLCRNEEPSLSIEVVRELLSVIVLLLGHTDHTILVNTFWALSFLMDPSSDILQLVIDTGMVDRLLPYLAESDTKLVVPVLRILGNLTTGTDEQTQVLLNAGILTYFPQVLTNPKEKVHQGAVWLLSNVLAGTVSQVQAVIDMHLLPILLQHLATSNFATQKEAAWAFSNLSLTGSQEQVNMAVELGVVAPLCNLLTVYDTQVVRVVLNTLHNLLKLSPTTPTRYTPVTDQVEECGGLDKIVCLQYSENEGIRKLASLLIDVFWTEKDEMVNEPAAIHPEFSPQTNLPKDDFQF